MESDQERERFAEENDQLSRSTKKMKRSLGTNPDVGDTDSMDLGSPRTLNEGQGRHPGINPRSPGSYRDTLQRNNPNLTFDMHDNPIWAENCD